MKNPRALILGLAPAALLVFAPPATAQPAVDARLSVAADARESGALESETRATVEGSFTPELGFASEHGRATTSSTAAASTLPETGASSATRFGASYRVDLGPAKKARVFVGGSGSWRRNGDAWSEADSDGRTAFLNLELRPRPGTTLRTGYRLADRSFTALTALDQLEQDAFLSLNLNLPSRTTLIAESHFGWKSYQGEALPDLIPAPLPRRRLPVRAGTEPAWAGA